MKRFATYLILTLCVLATRASVAVPYTHPGPLTPDSSNFVTASLVVISPGPSPESVVGHTAIRLECPAHDLDYCFSLETHPDYGALSLLLGQTPSHDIAIPTDEFVRPYIVKNRRITQYELNLTLHEKQELWRLADNEYTNASHRLFSCAEGAYSNCTSLNYHLIERSLVDERIVTEGILPELEGDNGEYFRHLTRKTPWGYFAMITLGGTVFDEKWNAGSFISPEVVIPLLAKSNFVGELGSRPTLVGGEKVLFNGSFEVKPLSFTPMIAFALLLLLALVITAFQRTRLGRGMARVFDIILFSSQSVVAVFLVFACCVGTIFGLHWNWYLIPFNPLPLVLWLCCRRRAWYPRVYGIYAIVLVLFILATPLSSQLDLEHQLLTATLAVRCAAHWWQHRV